MKISQHQLAFLLAALASLGPFAIDTYLPAFPAMAKQLGATPLQIQQTLTAYLIPFAFMMLWHGAISDALGRRRIILVGLAVFSLASILCACATRIEMLWLGRALQGCSAGVGMVVGRAMVRDVLEGASAQRLMAKIAMLFAIAPAVAPIVGGYVLRGFGWHGIFIFLAAISGGLLAACWAWLPETLPAEKRQSLHPRQLTHAYRAAFSHPVFMLLALANGLNFSAGFIYVLASPVFLIKHLGLTPQDFAVLFIPQVAGMMTGSFMSGRLAGRLPHHHTIMISYAIMGAAALLNLTINLTLPPGLPWSVAPLPLFWCGMSLAMPNMQLLALDLFPKRRGLASSALGAVHTSTSTISAALVIPLLWGSTLGLASGMAVFLSLGGLAFFLTQARVWNKTPAQKVGAGDTAGN